MDINDVVIHGNETLDAQARHNMEESYGQSMGSLPHALTTAEPIFWWWPTLT